MSILSYISPLAIISKLMRMVNELNNLIFYHSTINKIKSSNMHTVYGLKIDKVNRMYAVVNIPPEVLMFFSNEELIQHEKEYVGNELLKFNKLYVDNGILEFIRYNFERVKDENFYAYKVWTSFFKFKEITIPWLIWISVYMYVVVTLIASNWHHVAKLLSSL